MKILIGGSSDRCDEWLQPPARASIRAFSVLHLCAHGQTGSRHDAPRHAFEVVVDPLRAGLCAGAPNTRV
ncbi:hypothetical protein ACS5PM_05735 [Ideonella sp. YS5]